MYGYRRSAFVFDGPGYEVRVYGHQVENSSSTGHSYAAFVSIAHHFGHSFYH
jgi:hypothetical protein